MKKVFNYIIAITLLLFVATSCTKVLDKKSVDSLTQDQVFSEISTTNAFLDNCYEMMGSYGGTTGGGWLASNLGGRQDLLAACTDQCLNLFNPDQDNFLKGTLSPDFLGYFGWNRKFGILYWDGLYANIQNVNTIIANIDKVPTASTEDVAHIQQMKGEAYFIRAYEYTQLLRGHGGVVIIDKPFLLGQDFLSIGRSTIEQTKDFIIADIAQAIALLPETMEQGRATRAAAAALKSRLLTFCASTLTNGGYAADNLLVSFPAGSRTALLQAERDAAKEVMDGTYGTFSLVGTTDDPPSPLSAADIKRYSDNFFSIFIQKGEWNSETIWGVNHVATGGNTWDPNSWYGPNGYHCCGDNSPLEPVVRSFEMADGTPFVWDAYIPGNQFLRTATAAQLAADPNRNPYNGREPRFYASILYDGAPWQARPLDVAPSEPNNVIQTRNFYGADSVKIKAGVDTRQSVFDSWNATKNGYYFKKYQDPATDGEYFSNTNVWVEFRYSEILLDYAEACIELGGTDLQKGIDALNMVRNRAGLPDRVTTDQATARTYLRHERAIEFYGEDQRWYDIRRWMIASDVITNVYEMKISQFDNGDMVWKYDLTSMVDERTFNPINYWLPISRDEINKAPQLQQNPGY